MLKKKIEIPVYVLLIIGLIVLLIPLGIFMLIKIEDAMYEKDIQKEYSEISIDVPKEFEKMGKYSFYSYSNDGVSCHIDIYPSEKYEKNFEKWFKSNVYNDLNDTVSDIKEESINGYKVLTTVVKSPSHTEYYYGFNGTNYYYNITYDIYDSSNGDRVDTDSNLCFTAKDAILSSVKLK